jgi:hypothetical protein
VALVLLAYDVWKDAARPDPSALPLTAGPLDNPSPWMTGPGPLDDASTAGSLLPALFAQNSPHGPGHALGVISFLVLAVSKNPLGDLPIVLLIAVLIGPLEGVILASVAALLEHLRPTGVRQDGTICPACGYSLEGNESGTCPECGLDVGPMLEERLAQDEPEPNGE